MSQPEVPFAGTLSEAQFSRVQGALLPVWARWYVFAPTCLLAFVALGAGWHESIAQPSRALPDLALGAAVFAACCLITRHGRRRAWQNYMRLHGAIAGSIGPQGIEWKTEASTTSLSWQKLIGFRVLDDLVLVFYAKRCAFFLPRDFFASEQDWLALRAVLSVHAKTMSSW